MKVYGTGSVRPIDGDEAHASKWQLIVRTDAGQRTRVVSGKRNHFGKKAALAALEEFRAQVELEADAAPGITFGAYAEKWLAWRADETAANTRARDATQVRLLNRAFEHVPLASLDPAQVRDGLVSLRHGGSATGRDLSGTYMNAVVKTLKLITRQALADGVIAHDPCDGLRLPRKDTKEKDFLPEDELADLARNLEARMPDPRAMACLLMVEAGLRRGEACGLYVDDIDFQAGMLHIRRSVKEADGTVGPPKSECGNRDLPMTPRLARSCTQMLEWRDGMGLSGAQTLCCSHIGTPLRPQNLYRWWNESRDALGAPGLTLHQLRHSNLTKMARYFPSPFDLQRWAGWSSLEPAKVYIHQNMDAMKQAVWRAAMAESDQAPIATSTAQKPTAMAL